MSPIKLNPANEPLKVTALPRKASVLPKHSVRAEEQRGDRMKGAVEWDHAGAEGCAGAQEASPEAPVTRSTLQATPLELKRKN